MTTKPFVDNNSYVFWGENQRFAPKPFHKSSFPHYTPYSVRTEHINIPKKQLHLYYSRFHHLDNINIPQSHFKHPHLKGHEIDPQKVKYETYKVDYLGIKGHMEKGSRPNEAKNEMLGLKKVTVGDFTKMNLQEEAGTESTLSRHRDNQKYDVTVLPFEEQYRKFLESKKEVQHADNEAHDMLKDIMNMTEADKQKVLKNKQNAEIKISKYRKKKTVVQPIVQPNSPVASSTPPPTSSTPPPKTNNPSTSPINASISPITPSTPPITPSGVDNNSNINMMESQYNDVVENFKPLNSKMKPTEAQIKLANDLGIEIGRKKQAGVMKEIKEKYNAILKQGQKGFVQQQTEILDDSSLRTPSPPMPPASGNLVERLSKVLKSSKKRKKED